MYSVARDFTFSAAHTIRGHTGGCQRMHGHTYRVRIHLTASELDELGMVLDFADLKTIAQEVLDPFDHRVINDVPPFDRRNPTAEQFAEYVHDQVSQRMPRRVKVTEVEVWENPHSGASFRPGD